MDQVKNPKKDTQRLAKELNPYKDILRDASFLFEDKVLELSLLRRVGDILGYILDLESFYRMFIDILLEETNAENCSFMVVDTETDKLVLKMARGRNDNGTFFDHPGDSGVAFSLGEGVAGKVALEGEPILIDEVSKDKRFEERETRFPIGSLLCTPLIFQENVLGVINLSHSQPHVFNQNNKRIMELLCAFVSSILGNAIDYIKVKDQEKFRTMFEGVSLPILLIDTEMGKIVDCNRYTEEWLGYSKGELLNLEQVFDRLLPCHREEAKQILRGIIKKNSSEFNEISFIKKDGSVKIGEINRTTISYQGRNVVQLTIRDITERKKTEEELREIKDHLDNIIESSLDAIVISDNTGHITRVNKSFLQLIGYEEEEVKGKHIMELSLTEGGRYESTTGESTEIDEEFFNDARKVTYEELIKGGKITNWETYYLHKDRKVIPVEQNIVYLYNEKGDIVGAVGIIRDITERRKAENEIMESRDFLENIFKTSADAILVTDPQGNITMVNDSMEMMVGYAKNELLGKHVDILKPTDEEICSKMDKEHEKFLQKGRIFESETVWQRKNGQHLFVETNMCLLKDKDRQIIGAVSINRDVSERKKMEQQLLQSEKLKSLGELAGGVAHDFNNVLATILGRAQLLKMNVEPQLGKEERRKSVIELKKGLEIIEKAAKDGAETVRRIQEFARRRDEDKYFTSIDLNEIIKSALEFTRVRWKDEAESKGIKIKIQKDLSSLPFITGSAAELREVITNLINNAFDVMPQGGNIKIKTFKEGPYVSIRIEDTGAGIPKAIRDRIFDPFFTTKGVKFSGLGLSVSHGIINRHQGTISVNSVEGEGTTFTIKLPISEKVNEEEQIKPTAEKQRKAKILVIEDEEDVRDILSAILIMDGHEVEAASNGSQGVEIFRKKEFDLVFTDLGMPGMSGWQVADGIKEINRNTPVALITGWGVQLKDSDLRKCGVDFIINKPFQVDQVLRLVQEGIILRDRFKRSERN